MVLNHRFPREPISDYTWLSTMGGGFSIRFLISSLTRFRVLTSGLQFRGVKVRADVVADC